MSGELTSASRPGTQFSAPLSSSLTARSGRYSDQLVMLREISQQMATVEDLSAVLQSITTALAERANAVHARIFLFLHDHECQICAERIAAGVQTPSDQRALHLLATAGPLSDLSGPEHRAALDAQRPASEIFRTRSPLHYPNARQSETAMRDPFISRVVREQGVVGLAGYPLTFHDEQLGIIGYLSRHTISVEEFELLGIFADQAAMTIKSAYLFRELERSKDRLQVENSYLQDEIRSAHGFEGIVGESPALRAVLRKVRQVAAVETTVLLTGETGTGKELIARAIQAGSPRKDRPMIKINCGAIPQGVVESELFGHEKGAFTGALQRRIGRFELADKGTLFMDEVGELPLETQVKLLRVLQEQEFERVGSTRPMTVDVRLIAATNRDLEQEVAAGRFRADLFYRLNVFPIRIPPLRERAADIPLLVQHMLAQLQRKLAKPLASVTPASMAMLQQYSWPGNIRELQNVLERACVLASSPVVSIEGVDRGASAVAAGGPGSAGRASLAGQRGAASIADGEEQGGLVSLDDNERAHIRRALAACGGRINGAKGAAAVLGINPNTLRSRMQKLGIGKGGA